MNTDGQTKLAVAVGGVLTALTCLICLTYLAATLDGAIGAAVVDTLKFVLSGATTGGGMLAMHAMNQRTTEKAVEAVQTAAVTASAAAAATQSATATQNGNAAGSA